MGKCVGGDEGSVRERMEKYGEKYRYGKVCWGVGAGAGGLGRCWERCRKVCWGVREDGGCVKKCWGRCGKVCWGVGKC